MSNKGLLATVAAAALATVGLVSQGRAQTAPLPGSPEPATGITRAAALGVDPFMMGFDENGNAFVRIFSNGSYGPPTTLKPIVGDPFLTFNLPEPVVPGDVSFAEPPSTSCTSAPNCSDGLRFTLAGGKSTMSFFSDIETGEPRALADTGFPDNFDFTSFAFKEVGAENGLNGFVYNAGPGDPALTNVYGGISDNVPEASTWAMMIIGFAGLGYASFRRARVSVSAA
jgi:hypothetical protein